MFTACFDEIFDFVIRLTNARTAISNIYEDLFSSLIIVHLDSTANTKHKICCLFFDIFGLLKFELFGRIGLSWLE